jgi:hypothetical protein
MDDSSPVFSMFKEWYTQGNLNQASSCVTEQTLTLFGNTSSVWMEIYFYCQSAFTIPIYCCRIEINILLMS